MHRWPVSQGTGEETLTATVGQQIANQWILHQLYNYIFGIPRILLSTHRGIRFVNYIDADHPRVYLQNPYYFMVISLVDADQCRRGQLSAGLQGESDTQSALAGCHVSSLHRLKDIDNVGEYRFYSSHFLFYS